MRMGYTHYWYRPKEIPEDKFRVIVVDFKKLLPLFRRLGIKLAGGLGTGRPKVNDQEVVFNGSRFCGHPKNGISIPWPAPQVKFGVAPKPTKAVVGTWFAGVVLDQRTCNGDCSYETFYFPRVMPDRYEPVGLICYYDVNGQPVYNDKRVVGKYFDFCKTAFRPYDLAVNCFLIIARHHLGDDLIVRSDGTAAHWVDAVTICFNAFKYNDFVLNDKEVEPLVSQTITP